MIPHLLCDQRAYSIGAGTVCPSRGQKWGYVILFQDFFDRNSRLIGKNFRDQKFNLLKELEFRQAM